MHDNVSYTALFVLCFIMLFIMVAITVVALITYVKRNNTMLKQQLRAQTKEDIDTFKNEIQALNRDLFSNVVNTMRSEPVKEAEHKKSQEELVTTFTKIRHIMKDDLYAIMNATKACRTAMYLFHNGTKSTSGLSFLKISCVGERILVGAGVKEQILNHSNMPINIFDDMIEKLVDGGRYLVMNDEETSHTARRQFLSAAKIRYTQLVSIYDTSNNILGFILAEFDHAYAKAVADAEFKSLKELATKISPILSFSEYAELTLQNDIVDIMQRD